MVKITKKELMIMIRCRDVALQLLNISHIRRIVFDFAAHQAMKLYYF